MVHVNSLVTYYEELNRFGKREKQIYGHLAMTYKAQTDREVRNALFDMSADMNTVRPRITDLKKRGWVEEIGKVPDPVTKKMVRLVRAVTPEQKFTKESVPKVQQELW